MERYSGIWLPRFRLALTHPLFETSFHLPLSEAILFILFFFLLFSFPSSTDTSPFFLFFSPLSLSLLEGTFVSGSTTLEKTLSSRVVYSWFRRPTNSFSPICCAPWLLPPFSSSSSSSSIKRTRLTRGVYPPRPIN